MITLNIHKYLKILILLYLFISVNTLAAQNYRSLKEVKGLVVGSKAPLFESFDQNKNKYNLSEALLKGPVILIFYRGQWCPYCNLHLSNMQDSLELIQNKGASVIAVSPEKSELLSQSAQKSGAQFILLHDEGYKISDAYGVSFRPNAYKRMIYNIFSRARLKSAHSDESQRLPVPATYVIGKDGIIKWRHFDADYKKRSSVKDILEEL